MKIDLNDHEQSLVAIIEFDQSKIREHEVWKRNSEIEYQLVSSLFARNAIPEIRMRYFSDPDCNPGGRGKSRKQRFLDNTKSYDEMYRHNNFLAYLRYFIYGPDLPAGLIANFTRAVADCGQVTSGDIETLRKTARTLVRRYGLNRSDADEFYQLALETVGSFYAESIRDAVKQLK